MCGRFSLHTVRERIAEHFEIDEWSETRIPFTLPRFNVAPSQVVPAVRLNAEGKREIAGLRWGLIPHWAHEPNTGYSTINARAETVATKPAFRESFRRRRCLIPSDGFYEWQGAGKQKKPWLIHLKSSDLFSFAGLWDRWEGRNGEALETFTVIVTEANDLVRPIHDRMPVILDPTDYDRWLDVERFDRPRLEALLKPYPSVRMDAYPVSTRVNSPKNDDELCGVPEGRP